jgi:hypothetical protein
LGVEEQAPNTRAAKAAKKVHLKIYCIGFDYIIPEDLKTIDHKKGHPCGWPFENLRDKSLRNCT